LRKNLLLLFLFDFVLFLRASLTDNYAKTPMAITAENLAEKYKITRKEVKKKLKK